MRICASISTFALLCTLTTLTVGCGDDSDDTGGTGNTADGGMSDGGGTTVDDVALTVSMTEFLSGDPLEGATVTLGDDTQTADAAGSASFTLAPDQYIDLAVELEGYRNTWLHRYQGPVSLNASYLVPSNATLSALSSLIGVPIDPAKGLVAVSILDFDPTVEDGSFSGLAGTTVELDVGYDVALVLDSSSATGMSEGSTTLPDSGATVIFLNVQAGTVAPTVTPPSGFVCDYGHDDFTVQAEGYHVLTYYCGE